MENDSTISIDVLSSIPDEALDASGPLGRTYAAQLSADQAEYHYSFVLDNVDQALRDQAPAGAIVDSNQAWNHPDVVAARERLFAAREKVREMQAEVGGIVFLPAVDNLEKIQKKLISLNKKAARLDTEPITLKVSDERLILNYTYYQDQFVNEHADFEHVFVVLSGSTPKIPGFEFLATINHTEGGNLIKRVPSWGFHIRVGQHDSEWAQENRVVTEEDAKRFIDNIDLAKYRDTGAICEQCGYYRDRLDTFIVLNYKTGETRQVGRNCLADYTGTNNPERVVKALEQVWEFMRGIHARGEQPRIPTSVFLTHGAAVMRSQGRYIKGLGWDAQANFWNWIEKKKDGRGLPLYIEPQPVDEQTAQQMLKWVHNEWNEDSEFAHNVKVALAAPTVDPKGYGLAGAVFSAYDRAQAKARQQEAVADKEFVGTVGEREDFTLTVKQIKWIEDTYSYDGTKPLIIMEDEKGNNIKWFASNLPRVEDRYPDGPTIGGTYVVKATVKKHEDHERFGKSTMINRAKFLKTVSEPNDE